jgi:hypothetical protein
LSSSYPPGAFRNQDYSASDASSHQSRKKQKYYWYWVSKKPEFGNRIREMSPVAESPPHSRQNTPSPIRTPVMASPPQIDIPVVEENTVYTMKEKLERVTSKSELDSLISKVKKVDKTKCCPFCEKKPEGYSCIKHRNQHITSYCSVVTLMRNKLNIIVEKQPAKKNIKVPQSAEQGESSVSLAQDIQSSSEATEVSAVSVEENLSGMFGKYLIFLALYELLIRTGNKADCV